MAKTDKSLHGTVSRRIFLLFVICALVPITAHSLFSFFQVRWQLIDQSRHRLDDQTKQISLSVFERLILLNDDLNMLADRLRGMPPASIEESIDQIVVTSGSRFRTLAHDTDSALLTVLPDGAEAHLGDGKAVLSCSGEGNPPAVFLHVALDAGNPLSGLLGGEVSPDFLWHPARARPAQTELAALTGGGATLFSTTAGPARFGSRGADSLAEKHKGNFRYRAGGEEYLASHRLIFLQPMFLSPPWVMTVSEPMAAVLEPAADFQRDFPLILLLTLTTVVALSLIRIRQTLTPVRRLQEATRKIADGDREFQVEVRSGDEFQVLGESLNWMNRQLKENESLLIQAERLGTIGRMSASMVHEIKQPMTAISGQLELAMLGSLPPDTEKRLEKINDSMKWLFSLVDKYRMFSRKPDEALRRISLAEVTTRVYELFEHQFLMRQIQCRLHNQPSQPDIKGDGMELQQVVTNLLTNAMDAIDAVDGGRREIEIRTVAVNGNVTIRISDTGCGISPEDQERMFDPFFTTKSAEKGTGLGMAVTRTILDRHSARIEVESQPGKGTAFTITFPTISGAAGRSAETATTVF